jgi:hypothetical protein
MSDEANTLPQRGRRAGLIETVAIVLLAILAGYAAAT